MEYDLSYDDSPSLKQTLADLLRGMSKKQAYQELGQGIQNTAKVIPSVVESLGRGAIAQVPGTFGDISQLARQFAPETMQSVMGNRVAPTTEEILAKIPRLNPDYQGSSQHETIGGLISPAMPSLLRAGAKATQNMPIGNMIAYHGTPHEIKGGFDISKVGTGEGAQAYGHGMYFAENPAVAKEYQKLEPVNGPSLYTRRTFKGEELTPQTPEYHAAHMVDKLGLKKAKEEFENWLKNPPNYADENLKSNWQKSLDILKNTNKKSDFGTLKHEGNLYKVDIPDKDIPNILDWDKPINQQSDAVKKALGLSEDKYAYFKIPATGTNYSFAPNMTGNELYKELTNLSKTQAKASELLNSLGIKGIRYLDQGSRDKGGTSNFVVFDPKEVKILEKNNKSVNNLENVIAPLKEKGVTLDIYESKNNPNKLVISKIEVPKELRQSGIGTNAMQELANFADKQNKTITLSPSTDFGASSVSRLKDFYKRFGFVENKGRNKDYSISESMYRSPEKTSRREIIEEQLNNIKK